MDKARGSLVFKSLKTFSAGTPFFNKPSALLKTLELEVLYTAPVLLSFH